jgi:hypothetical protein
VPAAAITASRNIFAPSSRLTVSVIAAAVPACRAGTTEMIRYRPSTHCTSETAAAAALQDLVQRVGSGG